MRNTILFCALTALCSCQWNGDGDSAASDVAVRWAEAFFNADYVAAQQLATPESGQWLRLAASNTTQQDLDLLQSNGEGALVSQDGYQSVNDTLALVTLDVRNYVHPAAIGDSVGTLRDGAFEVKVVKRGDEWRVKMEGLPRSGRQSRD